jgi:phytoene dehydrogenase-like protein
MVQRVIVVGGGLAGLSAAHTVYLAGGNVLVLDKQGTFFFVGASFTTLRLTAAAHQVSSAAILPRLLRVSTALSLAPRLMRGSATV